MMTRDTRYITSQISLGGGKYKLAHPTLPCPQNTHSDYVPSIPQDTKISAITFRNKQNGWKSYRMEIRFK